MKSFVFVMCKYNISGFICTATITKLIFIAFAQIVMSKN